MHSTLRSPEQTRELFPELAPTRGPSVWIYRCEHPTEGWILSIATHAEPGSQKLSLGGFRIAPLERTSSPDFDPDREAAGLAIGMEEKVYWSRLINVGGPLARRDINRVVGGKCVLQPTADARVGQPRDFELLDWAIECFQRFELECGVNLTTGQDLGHGLMSDGVTQSLDYLSSRFRGSVDADTSKPTAEGNLNVLEGMLDAIGIPLERATIGLIGVGNIGHHIYGRLRARGASILAVESREDRRAEIIADGHRAWPASGKGELLAAPIDALVVNASGGSLDPQTIAAIEANPRLKVICGSENLVMPDASGAERLRAAQKVCCPTELGGMMGYLTAVEEYLALQSRTPFHMNDMFEAAKTLHGAAKDATSLVVEREFAISFEDSVRELYRRPR